MTDLDKSKQGIAIALSFPEKDEHNLLKKHLVTYQLTILKLRMDFIYN